MNDLPSITDKLNPAQLDAVISTEGPLLVIAGAGSGKTRVITHRIAYLVREKGVAPWEIFAATFTNKAAEEMRERIRKMLPGYETARLTIGTFHSICGQILRSEATRVGLLNNKFTICDDSDQIALIKDCMRELGFTESKLTPEGARNFITRAKTLMGKADEVRAAMNAPRIDGGHATEPPPEIGHPSAAQLRLHLGGEMAPQYSRIYSMYEERLLKNNAVDFDDMLLLVVRLFATQPEVLALYQERWRYFLVDEYQDTNRVQCDLMRLLASRERNLCVVGDEDQSIYSWRGAEIENILNFTDEFEGARIVRLETNYRSTQTILEAAQAVIGHNTLRLGKNLVSAKGRGDSLIRIVGEDDREEARQSVKAIMRLRRLGVPGREIAIFYRMNALSRVFEDALREADLDYRVVGGVRFYDRAEIKDMLAYLRLASNPADGISLARIINKPRRGIGDKTLAKIFSDATAARISLWEQIVLAVRDEGVPKKARAGIADLIQGIIKWKEMAVTRKPTELLDRVLADTGYADSLGDPESLETLSRIENLTELRRAIEEWEKENPEAGLDAYLEKVSLTAALDGADPTDDTISLMTLHSAKGLEYACVFLAGLEEGIFPSGRVINEGRGLEEERRLFYVGVTRARDRLFLCRSESRTMYGRRAYNPPSSFLREIPPALVKPLELAAKEWQPLDLGGGMPRPRVMGRPGQAASARPAAFADPAAARAMGGGAAEEELSVADDYLFPPGCRIRHKQLGEGEVLEVKGEGERRKISIRFDAGVELEVLERFGGLERVEGDLPF